MSRIGGCFFHAETPEARPNPVGIPVESVWKGARLVMPRVARKRPSRHGSALTMVPAARDRPRTTHNRQVRVCPPHSQLRAGTRVAFGAPTHPQTDRCFYDEE